MSYLNVASGDVVASLPGEARAGFIRRTYAHVAGALTLLAISVAVLLKAGVGQLMLSLLGTGTLSFLIVFGLFYGACTIANNWAHSGKSREMQYAVMLHARYSTQDWVYTLLPKRLSFYR